MDTNNNGSGIVASKAKILVVDDREDNLLSIETILEKDGYEIVRADSGRAALKHLLKQQDFTLILMDVQMPGLSGFETASMIYDSERMKHIPIIFITAHDHGEDSIFRGYQLGGVDYIYKPINPDLLRVKVAVFVELYHKNQELQLQEQQLKIANKELEREIRERKTSEEKVYQLNSQLVENINQLQTTNEELERFAYVASHDMQEPLRKIILFSGRVHDEYGESVGEQGRDFLQRVMKASERMQLMIRNLLSFSRSSNDNGEMMETTDLNQLVHSVLTDLEVYIAQKNAIVTIGELPSLIVNPSDIRQVFQNLIINALKFSKENVVPEISITSYSATGNGHVNGSSPGFYDISVIDNGIGFNMDYSDQIFMPFKRLHTQDQFEGTGIGLSICRKIMEKHSGSISVISEPDKGSTFTLSLPTKKEMMAARAQFRE